MAIYLYSIMTILTVNWADAWGLAGVSVGMVFIILLMIICVLHIFSMTARKNNNKTVNMKCNDKNQAKTLENASDAEKAAVAMAIYLYLNDGHDKESGVLTIEQTPTSWGPILNSRF